MTATNPVPWINPLNSRMFGNYQHGQNAMLPAATPFNQSMIPNENGPSVPNQLGMPQLGVQEIDTIGLQQRYPGLVVCDDGTMLDIDTHSVICDPNQRFKDAGYWGDPNKKSRRREGESYWNDTQINTFEPDPMMQNLSPEDVKYNKFVQQKSKELSSSMSDEQKELLRDIESGKILKLTTLEEVK